MPSEDEQAPLWTCPVCGHEFVTRNLWHSCGNYDLEAHFTGKDPVVRQIFDQLVERVQACGPVTMYAQKTRIVFMLRVRFAGVVTRKHFLFFSLWLKRPIEHPRLVLTETFGPGSYGHRFKLTSPAEIDAQLEQLICEAYTRDDKLDFAVQTSKPGSRRAK